MELMTAQQLLENFLINHPDYWNYYDELKEVQELKKACNNEIVKV